ncbi:hypothetical protein ACQ33O_05480 [Ferruginibacter sp. SUN002]|uniref:hypothetical protein n=1 Tax=Ferruginibacter sp. SUN002 TaxID=2937789 RepID=UPI003D36A776
MERNMFNDSFERMLREKADEFRMYPSARVWHSIYNNIHPGRRWPSTAMSIVLIGLLLLIGYTNSEKNTTKPITAIDANVSLGAIKSVSSKNTIPTELNILHTKSVTSLAGKNSGFGNSVQQLAKNSGAINHTKQRASINTTEVALLSIADNRISILPEQNTNNITDNIEPKLLPLTKRTIPVDDNTLTENIVAVDKLIDKKTVGKFGLQVYASPSVVYPNASDNISTNEVNKPSVGLEVGAAMKYALFKKLKVTTGLQLNYISYNSLGYLSGATTTNSLIKQSQPNQVIENSGLTNTTGLYPVNFRSETYQVSLPVGVEFKLLGKDRLHWDVGATIQPTYIMNGNNNNITDASSINNWNLNAGFETFITYKINGLTWQLGPQLRYQLISTYDKTNRFNENLANYGVKLGVSKILH